MADPDHFILASESPRRRDLLRQVGIVPDAIIPADVNETIRPDELPRELVLRLASDKARTVAAAHDGALVLAADTVVACGRRILAKPKDESEARACLHLLSGRAHHVYTAVCVVDRESLSYERIVDTRVHFKRLSDDDILSYLASSEWQGKAGGYGIQGMASLFIRSINGSYSNVVGLPLFETAQLLKGCGYPVLRG